MFTPPKETDIYFPASGVRLKHLHGNTYLLRRGNHLEFWEWTTGNLAALVLDEALGQVKIDREERDEKFRNPFE